MRRTLILLIGILYLNSVHISAQSFYDVNVVQKIEIMFSQPNWDYILDTAKQGSDSYSLAQWVKINGVQFDSVGVKYKGNSSYNANNAKNPLHIELDHFKNHDYNGYKDIKLSNGYHEPSVVREVMLYAIAQNYMKCSKANYAQVTINGQLWGLYTNTEAVTNTFIDDRFYSNNNTFIFADNGGCDIRYKGNDSLLYATPYTIKSDYGLNDLMLLCDSLKNNINNIENILDIDRTLWMLAFNNAFVVLDSYTGNSKHNYYLYEDHNNRFNPIIWDLNGGIGIFNKLNTGGIGLTTLQMQNMSPMAHSADSLWPLIKNILAVQTYKRMYIAHMKTLMKDNIDNLSYITLAQSLQSVIDTAVQSDPNAFYTYAQFLANLNSTIIDGPKTIPGITEFMNARNAFLNSTLEFTQAAPVISNVNPSNTFPPINTSIFITATVTNANAVYLGWRYSVMERFTRTLMYDDGLHGDGGAGDGIFGVSVVASQPELQYYIYAENTNAGIFLPERAEHVYYTLTTNYASLQPGDVVINEIMAMNNSTVMNVNGLYQDWIELYNKTNNTVSLNYLNLSDNKNNLTKWQFPLGVSIPPYSYQIIWADDTIGLTELHCNFKLSGNDEQVILSYPNGLVIDSVSYPTQTSDITWGRYPNGTGPFGYMPPTFNGINSPIGIVDINSQANHSIQLYPNPSSGHFTILHNQGQLKSIRIFDMLGKSVFEKELKTMNVDLKLSLPNGLYFYQVRDDQQFIYSGKLSIRN